MLVLLRQWGQRIYIRPVDRNVLLSHPDIKTPTNGEIFSINEGNDQVPEGSDSTPNFVTRLQTANDHTARFMGSLVADFPETCSIGIIYILLLRLHQWQLRLLYECAPLAWIIEQAGKSIRWLWKNTRHSHSRSSSKSTTVYWSSQMVERPSNTC